LLLGAAALSCLTWGYLALLFFPLLPLSLIAVIFLGLGFCGLCPFAALAVSTVQLVRDYRAVRERLPRSWAVAGLLAPLLVPPATAISTVVVTHHRRARLAAAVARVQALPRFSTERMRAIAALAGSEQRLVHLYVSRVEPDQRLVIAEAYHRLTDEPLDGSVLQREGRGDRALLRPFAFLDGDSPFSENPLRWVPGPR
jgi:hypothetical protein